MYIVGRPGIVYPCAGPEGPTRGYQTRNTSQTFTFGGYLEVKNLFIPECFFGTGDKNHLGTRVGLPRYEGPCMVCESG